MCGRYTITKRPEDIKKIIPFRGDTSKFRPRFNVAPTQSAPVIKASEEWTWMQWGLIPSWAKDASIGSKMINARSETVHQKPSFKRLLKSHRCVVPADGFFEWKQAGSQKQPYYMQVNDGQPFLFAGLWDHWQTPEGDDLQTFTLLTTAANATMESIHHRMPVILFDDALAQWAGNAPLTDADIQSLCAPLSRHAISIRPLSTKVNRATHDAPDCIEPMDPGPDPQPATQPLEFNFEPPDKPA